MTSRKSPVVNTAIQTVAAFAFQGERGAFSEVAGHRFFGPDAGIVPCRDFDELFLAVVSERCIAAVVPIENTLAGSIIKNYDLLLDHDVVIVGEVVLRVVHNLIGMPDASLADIRRVYSLPVALAQCERFLRAHPQIEAVAGYDTAGSVKMVMEAGRRDEAAIAGAAAAEVYGAKILAPGIESSAHNFTRFLVVTRPERAAAVLRPIPSGDAKTSIILRVAHRAGGLYRALAAFADEGVSLTKIESRPLPDRPFEYSFYLDFLGDPAEPSTGRALSKLRELAENVRVLGTYPRAEVLARETPNP